MSSDQVLRPSQMRDAVLGELVVGRVGGLHRSGRSHAVMFSERTALCGRTVSPGLVPWADAVYRCSRCAKAAS